MEDFVSFDLSGLSHHPNLSSDPDGHPPLQVRGRHGNRWQLQWLRQVCRGFPQAWSLPQGPSQIIGKIIGKIIQISGVIREAPRAKSAVFFNIIQKCSKILLQILYNY